MAEVSRQTENGAVAVRTLEDSPAPALANNQSAVETAQQFVTPFSRPAIAVNDRQPSLHWSAPTPVAGQVVIKTEAALSQLWLAHGGATADQPKINFEQFMIVGIFAGAGFFREVPSIDRVKVLADEVVVYVSRFSRPWSKRNAQAVVQIPQTDLPVRFVSLS